MKRFVLALLAPLALSYVAARDSIYLGVRLTGATLLEEIGDGAPFLGVQLGVQALDPVELRAAIDISVGVGYAQAELLYSQPLGDSFKGYVGAGLDSYSDGWNGETDFGVHGTAGVEYRTGIVGFFGEVQPIYGFGIAAFRMRSSLGVNFHF